MFLNEPETQAKTEVMFYNKAFDIYNQLTKELDHDGVILQYDLQNNVVYKTLTKAEQRKTRTKLNVYYTYARVGNPRYVKK